MGRLGTRKKRLGLKRSRRGCVPNGSDFAERSKRVVRAQLTGASGIICWEGP